VRIPAAGEVEVVASDYAGNRAVLTLSVPGRESPAGPADRER